MTVCCTHLQMLLYATFGEIFVSQLLIEYLNLLNFCISLFYKIKELS